MIKTLRRALPLILAATGLSVTLADAQTLPWPTAPGGGAAPPPMTALPSPATAAPAPMMASPQPPPGQALQQQCLEQFTALRETTEKLGGNAKAASERKVSREEMCKLVEAYTAAEAKWVKFTTDNATKCGVPPQIVKQLREAHSHTLVARKNVCATGPAGGPAAPTLSDALGTGRLPVPDGSRSGSGTLDTLTGNAIAR